MLEIMGGEIGELEGGLKLVQRGGAGGRQGNTVWGLACFGLRG